MASFLINFWLFCHSVATLDFGGLREHARASAAYGSLRRPRPRSPRARGTRTWRDARRGEDNKNAFRLIGDRGAGCTRGARGAVTAAGRLGLGLGKALDKPRPRGDGTKAGKAGGPKKPKPKKRPGGGPTRGLAHRNGGAEAERARAAAALDTPRRDRRDGTTTPTPGGTCPTRVIR